MSYSHLLDLVGGPTQASRRGVIDQYFTATADDIKNRRKVPSLAHRAIAELVAAGYVRVIVTTNFDNLTEQALHTVGVSPQVITQPKWVNSMEPLAHARATIIKLHGDVSELATRNTPIELSTYPDEWDDLLDRINNEYGLLISGWSGETDVALVSALKRNPMRRYPLYWDKRSSTRPEAEQILAMHRGQVVPAADADELFTSLAQSVKSLAKMSEPPLTAALAVGALKAAISDPTRHVEVEDLVLGAVRECVQEVSDRTEMDKSGYGELLDANLNSARRIVSLLVAGTYYDRERRYTDLWVEAVTGLMRARAPRPSFQAIAEQARLYPAALAVRAAGVLALHRSRPDVLLDLMRRPRTADSRDGALVRSALVWLHDRSVFERDWLSQLPGLGQRYPESQHLRAVTYEFVRDYFVDRREYELASDDYEFLIGLMQSLATGISMQFGVAQGLYMSDQQWVSMAKLLAAQRFRQAVALAEDEDDWPLWDVLGGRDEAEESINRFEKALLKRLLDSL